MSTECQSDITIYTHATENHKASYDHSLPQANEGYLVFAEGKFVELLQWMHFLSPINAPTTTSV